MNTERILRHFLKGLQGRCTALEAELARARGFSDVTNSQHTVLQSSVSELVRVVGPVRFAAAVQCLRKTAAEFGSMDEIVKSLAASPSPEGEALDEAVSVLAIRLGLESIIVVAP